MARFFIDRPVFAWVISLLIVLAGVLAIRFLPVAQYPDIAPPVVNVSASYPGASAKVVEEAVTAIIEREMNGAPGLLYTKATSSTGQASLTLTFRQGVNADLAAVEVQNRLKIVESRLPESVRRDGIYVEKAADSIQLIVTLTSSSGRYDAMELGEIASSNVLQALRRVEGVGKVETWGAEYAMRIWPDPAKLTSMNLSASDLVNAVRRHNARLTVGDIGNLGVPDSAPISATVKVDDTLVTPEQFGEIPLRRAHERGVAALVGCDIHPLHNASVLNLLRQWGHDEEQVRQWIGHWVGQGLAAVEQLIGDQGWCFGDRPGLADVYLIPQLYAAERFGVALDAWPRIRRVADLAAAHPAFRQAHPANQPDTPAA